MNANSSSKDRLKDWSVILGAAVGFGVLLYGAWGLISMAMPKRMTPAQSETLVTAELRLEEIRGRLDAAEPGMALIRKQLDGIAGIHAPEVGSISPLEVRPMPKVEAFDAWETEGKGNRGVAGSD